LGLSYDSDKRCLSPSGRDSATAIMPQNHRFMQDQLTVAVSLGHGNKVLEWSQTLVAGSNKNAHPHKP